jgi:hypothetical protein
MNPTVVDTKHAFPTTRLHIPHRDSLISKIMERLKTIAKTRFDQSGATAEHRSFVDANLLDETVGPEISRTLRR